MNAKHQPKDIPVQRALASGRLPQQAQLPGPGDCLGAVGRIELTHDVGDMALDGVQADHQLRSDRLIGPAGGQ